MVHSEIDYYKILGLGRHATDDDIKRAFRKLARDTHPDKNPNDPTAKERFQDLHRAYDTLKDNLERSKYDNDNPHHGTDRASAHRTPNGGARSGTAKRYTAGSSHNTTPAWANGTGTARNHDGFPQQAGSSRPRGWGGEYEPYDEWRSKTPPGYSYQTPRPPKAAPPPSDFEETHGGFKTKRESAYARTSGAERFHPTSAKGGAHHSGSSSTSSPRPKSTTGTNARYSAGAPSNSTPMPGGFCVADYIREKQAREEAERARGDADKQRAKEQARLKREAEELKRQEEERHKRAREAKERERRRAEEAARNPYADSNGFAGGHSTSAPNGYSYDYPTTMPSFYARRDDDELLREAEERVKERGKSAGGPRLNTHSRKTSRSSMRPKTEPMPPKWGKGHHAYESHGIPENWKHETTHDEDIDVVEATPTDTEAGKHDSTGADYFQKSAPKTGPEYVREDGTGVYPVPPLFNFNMPPVREKTPAQEQRPERPRSAMPGSFQTRNETPTPPTRKSKSSGGSADGSHETFKQDKQPEEGPKGEQPKQPPVNVFAFEERAPTPAKNEKPATPKYDFAFGRPFDTSTSDSPEPKGEKVTSTGSAPHLRPHSQPTQNHHSFIPPPSAPPNLQQQQQASENGKTEGSKFNRELYDDLLKRTIFDFLPSSSKKKRSAPTLNKGRNMHRTTSKESRQDSQPKAGSETESDEPKSASTATNSATAQPAATTGFGYEPMDAEPTGAPKTIPVPQNNRTKPFIPLANGMRKLNIGSKKGRTTASLNMSGMASVPPLSRSHADRGLGGFESLKESLPFPSQAATKPNVGLRMKVPVLNPTANESYAFSIPPDFWNLYPQTPLEQPFVVPKAPSVPKIPKQVSLDNYNRFYNSLGSYIEDWNKYEADVHALRAELTSKSLHVSSTELLDTQDIVKYMERVKNKDTILDQSFTKARDRHLASLDMWVKLRENVLKEVTHQDPH